MEEWGTEVGGGGGEGKGTVVVASFVVELKGSAYVRGGWSVRDWLGSRWSLIGIVEGEGSGVCGGGLCRRLTEETRRGKSERRPIIPDER